MEAREPPRIAIIGGGPAGLMAAEVARAAGAAVDLYEAKGSVGRKFLLAGKGGLNLTHSEDRPAFVSRFGGQSAWVADWLAEFDPGALRDWARGLGVETFVGSSGRVFPLDMKAAPLLRGWVRRLRDQGVDFHVQHRCLGWNADGDLRLSSPTGERTIRPDAVVLAMGGASWPELGSDGAWVDWLSGAPIAPLQPANCGFDVGWSEHFASRFAGEPIKPAVIEWTGADGLRHRRQGEFVITAGGIEGSLVYALSADLREAIARDGSVEIRLDLVPGLGLDALRAKLARPAPGRSLSERLRRQAGVTGAKAGLVHECLSREQREDPAQLAAALKSLPLRLLRPRPIAEAISSAGGVSASGLDRNLMLRDRPGVFCAGEMLDWEAPTGGYLLSACLASGRRAGQGAAAWLGLTARAKPGPVPAPADVEPGMGRR